MKGDLHCHSKLSDGSQGIEDIIAMSKKMNLNFVAITDHDTMSSHSRAKIVGDRYGVQIIPAVEFSAFDYQRGRRVHILCYMPLKPDRLEGMCIKICESRKKSGNEMAKKVMRLFPISPESITRHSASSKSVYKQHIMHALMDAGYTDSIYGELYDKLFSPENGCALVKTEYPDTREIMDLIHSAGGIAVLAHPVAYHNEELMEELAEAGLDGIEVWHPDHTEEDISRLSAFAASKGLLVTGGSDFHGMYTRHVRPLGSTSMPDECVQALLGFKDKRRKKNA